MGTILRPFVVLCDAYCGRVRQDNEVFRQLRCNRTWSERVLLFELDGTWVVVRISETWVGKEGVVITVD